MNVQNLVHRIRRRVRQFGDWCLRMVMYFIACLMLTLLAFSVILLVWTVFKPYLAVVAGAAFIGFLIFGPVRAWLTSLIETGTVTIHTPHAV